MEDRPVKVLMVVPNIRSSSGVTRFVMNYYRNVDHSKIQIDFATLQYRESPYYEEVEKCGSKVFNLGSLFRHPIKHHKNAKKVIAEGGYDIIHDNTLLQSVPVMKYAKKKVPVRILHSHNTKMGETPVKEFLNRLLLPILIRKANYFSACSSKAGEAMFGKRPFTVIPNIIDTDDLLFDNSKREEVRSRENSSDKEIIGTVGRLAAQKNPFFAMDVMDEVLSRRPDAVYWWIGNGVLDEEVKKYVETKKNKDRIRLFGSRDDANELYQGMDVFFLPSIFEGFGLSCIEAEAVGLPCVVSTEFPSEVNVTGKVILIPLDKGIDHWAGRIIDCIDEKYDRAECNEIVKASIYSKAGSGSVLSRYYEELVSGK